MQSYSWKLFLQFLFSPLVLETVPEFWIHLLRAGMLACHWTSDKTYPNPALVFCMERVWARVCFGMSEELPVVSVSRRFCHKHLPRTGVWMVSSEVKQVNSNIVSHFYLCWTRILFCQVYFAPINLTRVENTNMERIKPKMSESQNLLINRHLKAEISFTYFCWYT